jgi:hypothetical protein
MSRRVYLGGPRPEGGNVLHWLLRCVLGRGFLPERHNIDLRPMETLARCDAAGLLLAQESARLQFLAAQEAYGQQRSWFAFRQVLERLFQLQSTNALVQALLNERALERRLARFAEDGGAPQRAAVPMSR